MRAGERFSAVLKPTSCRGWLVQSERRGEEGEEGVEVVEAEYDMVFCATGRKVPLQGFERKSLEAKVRLEENEHTLETYPQRRQICHSKIR